MDEEKKELIIDTIKDLIPDLLYYDRKEDDDLKVFDIEKAINKNLISIDDIVEVFKSELIDYLKSK